MAEERSAAKRVRERGNPSLRFFDRYVGIPLLFFLGLWRRRRVLPRSLGRIALLKTAAIGDTVLISAVVQDLRREWPKAEITFFCGSSNREAALLIQGLDTVEQIAVASPWRALRQIRRHNRFDLLIDFGQWPRLDALLAGLSAARFTVGFRTAGQHRHALYDAAVLHRGDRHELDNFRALLDPLGVKGRAMPALRHRKQPRRAVRVVLHMFAGGLRSFQKEWPKENWRQLVERLLAGGRRLVLTGSREDRPRALELAAEVSASQGIEVVAGELDLPGLVDLLASSALLVTVNTGVMHLAAALGCPLVALNGPTSVLRWGPLGPGSVSLRSSRDCSPCLNLGFEYACDQNLCMRDIGLDRVLEAVNRQLAEEPGE